jgi:hypothetical protein
MARGRPQRQGPGPASRGRRRCRSTHGRWRARRADLVGRSAGSEGFRTRARRAGDRGARQIGRIGGQQRPSRRSLAQPRPDISQPPPTARPARCGRRRARDRPDSRPQAVLRNRWRRTPRAPPLSRKPCGVPPNKPSGSYGRLTTAFTVAVSVREPPGSSLPANAIGVPAVGCCSPLSRSIFVVVPRRSSRGPR